MTTTVAARAGRKSRRRGLEFRDVMRMLARLGTWAKPRADRVGEIYVVLAEDSAALYLITKAEAYDFALSDEWVAFASPYVGRGVVGKLMMLGASSPEELTSFFDPKLALKVTFE